MTNVSSQTKRFKNFFWIHGLVHEHFQDQSNNNINRLVHELPFIVHEIFMYTFMYPERKVNEPFDTSTAIRRSWFIHEISP